MLETILYIFYKSFINILFHKVIMNFEFNLNNHCLNVKNLSITNVVKENFSDKIEIKYFSI